MSDIHDQRNPNDRCRFCWFCMPLSSTGWGSSLASLFNRREGGCSSEWSGNRMEKSHTVVKTGTTKSWLLSSYIFMDSNLTADLLPFRCVPSSYTTTEDKTPDGSIDSRFFWIRWREVKCHVSFGNAEKIKWLPRLGCLLSVPRIVRILMERKKVIP